jgi:hypothetical protein
MAHDMTPEEQYELVYGSILDVAGNCDGAVDRDGVGFNGVDTKFGRRIASVPRSQWTPDVMLEACKIILKYRDQVLARTGVDVGTLSVVREAQDNGTNYAARNQARTYEKRAKHLAARQIGVVRNQKGQRVLGIRWANGDPDFDSFLKLVRDLPGRTWNGETKTNEVPYSPQVETFIEEWDFTVTEAGQAFIQAALTVAPVAPAPQVSYEITLGVDGRVVIKTNLTAPGQPAADAVRSLPGRSFNRSLYANTANAHPQVLAFARTFNLNVHPDAVRACEAAGAALQAADASGLAQTDIDMVMNTVSRCNGPEELPAVFVMMLKEILP